MLSAKPRDRERALSILLLTRMTKVQRPPSEKSDVSAILLDRG
jgi:hypothetical protein